MEKLLRTKVIFVSILAIMVAAPAAFAGVIKIDRVSGYYYGYGGEFNIAPDAGLNWVLNNYADSTKVNNRYGNLGFESFCLEWSEHVSPPGDYNYAISDRAIKGGESSSDIISVGTAWLYSEFAKGTLNGYNYTGDNRIASAQALQETIWYLEDEKWNNNSVSPPTDMTFLNLVIAKFGNLNGAKADNTDGGYGVRVLNLTKFDGTLAQDQLVLTPEPATMLLLGIALVGFAGARRKFHK